MYINCKNIDDFCTMITTCSLNNINDIRVFTSSKNSLPSVAFTNTPKNNMKFTYVLFSPLYTAIYSGNVKKENYETIYATLKQCQEQCKHSFRIQIFEQLSFDFEKQILYIDNELEVV